MTAPACNEAFLTSICKGFVKENALHQLQTVIKLLYEGFVKEGAPYQLQSVIKLFFKVCKENTSRQPQPVIKRFSKDFQHKLPQISPNLKSSFLKGLVHSKLSRPSDLIGQPDLGLMGGVSFFL